MTLQRHIILQMAAYFSILQDVKMLLAGYLYGIKSKRRIVQEIQYLALQLGVKKLPTHMVTKKVTTSMIDPECDYIHHGSKRGVGYLMEATVDCKHRIITEVDVFWQMRKKVFCFCGIGKDRKKDGLTCVGCPDG